MTRQGAVLAMRRSPNGTATWFVRVAGNIERMTREELESAYRMGRLADAAAAWTRGMNDWVPLQLLMQESRATLPRSSWPAEVEDDPEDEPTRPGKPPPHRSRTRRLASPAASEPAPGAAAMNREGPYRSPAAPPPAPPVAPSTRPPPPRSRRATGDRPRSTEPAPRRGAASRAQLDSVPPLDELARRSTAASLRPVEIRPWRWSARSSPSHSRGPHPQVPGARER